MNTTVTGAVAGSARHLHRFSWQRGRRLLARSSSRGGAAQHTDGAAGRTVAKVHTLMKSESLASGNSSSASISSSFGSRFGCGLRTAAGARV